MNQNTVLQTIQKMAYLLENLIPDTPEALKSELGHEGIDDHAIQNRLRKVLRQSALADFP